MSISTDEAVFKLYKWPAEQEAYILALRKARNAIPARPPSRWEPHAAACALTVADQIIQRLKRFSAKEFPTYAP